MAQLGAAASRMPRALLLVLLASCSAFSPDDRAPHASVIVPAAGMGAPTLRVSASVGSASAFLLSVEFLEGAEAEAVEEASAPTPLDSPSLDAARAMASGRLIPGGVRTAFGALLIGDDGRFVLQDAAGRTIVAATAPPALVADGATGRYGITMPTSGSKTGPGATGRRPCLANGNWGPPYTWDAVDGFLAFAVSPWSYDPDYLHCYPVSFDGKPPSSDAPPPHAQDSCTTLTHVAPFPNSSRELPGSPVAAAGGSSGDGTPTCCGACNAAPNCTAWVVDSHVKPGGRGCHLFACVGQWMPVPPLPVGASGYRYFSGGLERQCPELPAPASPYVHQAGWFGLGRRVDWYLAPTPAGGFDFTRALFELTGAPAVPPRFAMGFMATYWGYSSMAQVEGYMHEFRQRKLPIDSFIMDYDWFGPEPCGVNAGGSPDKNAQGGCNCGDSGYRRGWWDNVSFPQPDGKTTVHCATPADVLSHFKAPPLSMHFGAIRKPRTYSNLPLSQKNGWLLPNVSDVGEGGNINWNFSVPSLRSWYADTHAHFVRDGVDFWWNDEGETSWDTYLRWNEAQATIQQATKPNTRHFTLNRAWSPGMQRFPATAWTGDGQSCTHEELLRATLHGCPLISCDLTSPDATTLVRQYQSAVFTPLMRVHMMQGTPRFPWFWPNDANAPDYDAHQRAFRAALQLRYTFLPFLYSLAHAAYRTGRPIAHPASFAFPDECSRGGEGEGGEGGDGDRSGGGDCGGGAAERCRLAEAAYMVGGMLALPLPLSHPYPYPYPSPYPYPYPLPLPL